MTPVVATGAFPFAAGLYAGIDLQPAGLALLTGASLSVHTPTPIPRSEETPVAWNGSGEDFFLFPPTAAGGDLELYIQHLGGYGVARGTDAERGVELLREPVADDDLLNRRTSPLLRQGREATQGSATWKPEATSDLSDHIRELIKEDYDHQYEELRDEMLSTDGEPSVVIALVLRTLGWKAQVEHYYSGRWIRCSPGREAEIRSASRRSSSGRSPKSTTGARTTPTRCSGSLALPALLNNKASMSNSRSTQPCSV